jgi:hypothetical protein
MVLRLQVPGRNVDSGQDWIKRITHSDCFDIGLHARTTARTTGCSLTTCDKGDGWLQTVNMIRTSRETGKADKLTKN